MRKEQVLNHIKTRCFGKKATRKSIEIERTLSISGNELRKQVNDLRREGIPIASSRRGYFYAETAGDVYATIRQLEIMKRGIEAAIAGLVSSLDGFGERDD